MNNKQEVVDRLLKHGISYDDACTLRKISMTLHNWFELECGCDRGAIERDETTGKVYEVYDVRDTHGHWTQHRRPYPDKETPALKRLQGIMARYVGLSYYVQGDPRGCALYIVPESEIPADGTIEAYYSRGVPVYK